MRDDETSDFCIIGAVLSILSVVACLLVGSPLVRQHIRAVRAVRRYEQMRP